MGKPPSVRESQSRGLSKPPPPWGTPITQTAVATRPDVPQRGRHAGCLTEIEEVRRVLQGTVTEVIAAFAAAIEMKDKYAYGHSVREAGYAVALAQAMRLPEQQVEDIRRGALLHDIGMLFIDPRILRKPVELAEDEFEAVKKHAALGAAVVSKVQLVKEAAKIVRHHHERFDGSGYPDGLADDHIPLGARVVAVADAFGAMTEERSLPQDADAGGSAGRAGEARRRPVRPASGVRVRGAGATKSSAVSDPTGRESSPRRGGD